MTEDKFTKETQWDLAHTLCKVYKKLDKNGKPYLIGQLGNNNTITIRENTGVYAKENEYQVQIIPIKYRKENQDYKEGVEELKNTMAQTEDPEVPF